MKIELTINLELPRTWRRAIVGLGIPLAIVAGVSGLVLADVSLPNTFQPHTLISASDVNANFNALAAAINDDDPACPRGYTSAGAAATFLTDSTVCTKGKDEVVKVGTGASAFWIDRYEASAWTTKDATAGTQIADNVDTAYAAAGLQKNGQGKGVYALSVRDVVPSREMTWFQAQAMCRASGKRLPTGEEWLFAARGTVDPGANAGLGNLKCNTQDSGLRGTNKALGTAMLGSCASDWGAEDMVGNLWEWTAEWHAGTSATSSGTSATPWPSAGSYGSDGTWGISSYASDGYTGYVQGLPAAALRGGYWLFGTGDGVFSLSLSNAPSNWGDALGFRCVVPSR